MWFFSDAVVYFPYQLQPERAGSEDPKRSKSPVLGFVFGLSLKTAETGICTCSRAGSGWLGNISVFLIGRQNCL